MLTKLYTTRMPVNFNLSSPLRERQYPLLDSGDFRPVKCWARASFTIIPLHLSLSSLRYEVSLALQLQMLLLQLLENNIRSQ